MPIDINDLSEGWLELESDPGIFTLLLEDLGANGVQVEEVYDLQKTIEGPVFGFIFLFRWTEERRSRRKANPEADQFVKNELVVNNMFFAHQVVPNSCATHALLSILLNCPQVSLGPTLSRLKSDTTGMSPDNKGLAIGNTPELARAHNSHAVPQPPRAACDRNERNASISISGRFSAEAFHFVSYVPMDDRLFELDGLKPFPIDHGPWGGEEDWTELCRRVIQERIGSATAGGEPCHDIRFSLMAVVPDKRNALSQKLSLLRANRMIVLDALRQLASQSGVRLTDWKESATPGDQNAHTAAGEQLCMGPGGDGTFRAPITAALSIQASPEPSSYSYSTDTASESGSAINSPNQMLPQQLTSSDLTNSAYVKDFSRLVVVKMNSQSPAWEAGQGKQSGQTAAVDSQESPPSPTEPASKSSVPDPDIDRAKESTVQKEPFSRQQRFGPYDLMALFKSLEKEINTHETLLSEETEKRNKYRVDDCRRTHNYDEFICTFLSMLAEQGNLASLVEQNTTGRKRLHRSSPGSESPIGRLKNKGRTRYNKRGRGR